MSISKNRRHISKNAICMILMVIMLANVGGCSSKKGNSKVWITIISDTESTYIRELTDLFNSKYNNIIVNIQHVSNSESKNEMAKNKDEYDLWLGNVFQDTVELSEKGYFARYEPKGYNNIQEKFKLDKGTPRYTVLSGYTTSVVLNDKYTANNSEDLLNLLLRDDLKGQIDFMSPTDSGAGLLFLEDIYDVLGEKKAKEYYKALKDKNSNFKTKIYNTGRSLNKEETKGAVINDFAALYTVMDDYEVKNHYLQKEPNYNLDTIALVDKKDIKPEAKIFMDFVTSIDGLSYINKYRTITVNGQPSPIEGAKEIELKDINVQEQLKKRDKVMKLYLED